MVARGKTCNGQFTCAVYSERSAAYHCAICNWFCFGGIFIPLEHRIGYACCSRRNYCRCITTGNSGICQCNIGGGGKIIYLDGYQRFRRLRGTVLPGGGYIVPEAAGYIYRRAVVGGIAGHHGCLGRVVPFIGKGRIRVEHI